MSDRPYFPLFVDLSEQDILFVGAGSIAARRIRVLMPFASRITAVAPEADEAVQRLAEEGTLTWIRRPFGAQDLTGRALVFAATDDRALNARIASLCKTKGIPVNVASDHTLCDFYFPGIVQEGETVVGISASGRDHHKARRMRERIRDVLTDEEPAENRAVKETDEPKNPTEGARSREGMTTEAPEETK